MREPYVLGIWKNCNLYCMANTATKLFVYLTSSVMLKSALTDLSFPMNTLFHMNAHTLIRLVVSTFGWKSHIFSSGYYYDFIPSKEDLPQDSPLRYNKSLPFKENLPDGYVWVYHVRFSEVILTELHSGAEIYELDLKLFDGSLLTLQICSDYIDGVDEFKEYVKFQMSYKLLPHQALLSLAEKHKAYEQCEKEIKNLIEKSNVAFNSLESFKQMYYKGLASGATIIADRCISIGGKERNKLFVYVSQCSILRSSLLDKDLRINLNFNIGHKVLVLAIASKLGWKSHIFSSGYYYYVPSETDTAEDYAKAYHIRFSDVELTALNTDGDIYEMALELTDGSVQILQVLKANFKHLEDFKKRIELQSRVGLSKDQIALGLEDYKKCMENFEKEFIVECDHIRFCKPDEVSKLSSLFAFKQEYLANLALQVPILWIKPLDFDDKFVK